jgi:hypothetical protein
MELFGQAGVFMVFDPQQTQSGSACKGAVVNLKLRLLFLVQSTVLLTALACLFLHMEWGEDRLVPAASSSTLPDYVALQEARAPVIATKATVSTAPSEIAVASPIVVPTAISDCTVTPPELAATVGKSKAKAKRTAKAPTRGTPTRIPKFIQLAAVGRGSKEARH